VLSLSSTLRIVRATEPADMRKGFDGLSQLVRERIAQDPLSGHLDVFRNRRRDRIKVLYRDRDGLAPWDKKQEPDCPHPPAFTGIGRRPHNRAGRPSSADGMDRSSTPSDPRR
jgi:hypothetical protein